MIFFHKSNKKTAINQFIEAHWQTIHRLSIRLTGCPIDGQDLAHDVVVHIISQQKALTLKKGATAWVARVTYHLFIDQWRRKKNLRAKTYDNQSADQPEALANRWENQPCKEPGPEYAAALSQRQQQIIDALAQMSEPHRLLLILHDIEGYTLPEIQTITDLPLGTLKSRLHRARSKLRAQLQDQQYQLPEMIVL